MDIAGCRCAVDVFWIHKKKIPQQKQNGREGAKKRNASIVQFLSDIEVNN